MPLLIDIGGTNTRLAYSPDGTTLGSPKRISTPQNFDQAVQQITALGQEMADTAKLNGVVVGLPGPLNAEKTTTLAKHKFPDWAEKPLKRELEQALNTPVYIENDADLVGLGEATAGAGQGFTSVAYLTISTGVGGARLVDGRIDRAALGFEPGWQIIDADGTLCSGCPTPNRLEHLLGGAHVQKRFKQSPKDITDPAVWDQMAQWLALALNNVLVFWSPNVIVLGGPMMRDIPIDKVRGYTKEIASFLPAIPPIVAASLDDIGGLHGGLAYLQNHGA